MSSHFSNWSIQSVDPDPSDSPDDTGEPSPNEQKPDE